MEAQSPSHQTTGEVPSALLSDAGLRVSRDVFVGLGVRAVLALHSESGSAPPSLLVGAIFLPHHHGVPLCTGGPAISLAGYRLLCQSSVALTALSVSACSKSTSLGTETVSAVKHMHQLSQRHQ